MEPRDRESRRGARSRTRTGMALRPADFKSDASTDFAIRARTATAAIAYDTPPPARKADRPGRRATCDDGPSMPQDHGALCATRPPSRSPPRHVAAARKKKAPLARGFGVPIKPDPAYRVRNWRPRAESNRCKRICNPVHHHSATRPVTGRKHTACGDDCPRQAWATAEKTKPRMRGFVPEDDSSNLERETRLELATSTLAR